MKRRLIALALAIACILVLAACSGQGGAQSGQSSSNTAKAGLSVAYEKLKASDDVGSSDAFQYDEDSDALVVDLSEVDDLDSFFEIMDGAVDGADIGMLSLKGWGKDIDAKAVSKWLGGLPCNSLKCFDMGGSGAPSLTSVLDEEDDWTDLLAKTEAIYNPSTDAIRNFGPSARKNLSGVKAVWIGNTSSWGVDLDDCLRYMDGLEEIRICSGITSEEHEKNADKGFPFDNQDVGNLVEVQKGGGASLDRVLVFPELEKWEVSDGYATFMLALQYFLPDVKTNEPGKGWDGDDESLVAAADIDVVAANDSEEVVKALETLLYQNEAEVAFEKGKSFQQKDGMPKLDGTCFVYFGDPFPDSSSQWPEGAASPDYDKLFSYTHIAMVDEFAGTNVKTPHSAAKYDYFVYIYPTFEEVGTYGGVTAAYNTMTNVRVYDMKNEEKYESGVIETIEAPSEYHYSGSPDTRYWPNMNKETAIAYVAGLT